MLSGVKSPRHRAVRHPFLTPPWDEDHPAMRRIDATLPADHHARWLLRLVSQLDLTALRLCYANRGSLAYPVEPLLAFVLLMYSQGELSPARWAHHAKYDDQAKWLLRGLLPSRSRLYAFRDRLEPFLDEWHQQLLRWAIAEGITSAARGSLDGSLVAALASRHQLMSPRRVDRRLLLLRRLVWLEGEGPQPDLAARLADLPWLLVTAWVLCLDLLGAGVAAGPLLDTLLGLMVLLELLGPQGAPEGTMPWQPRLPAWVPPSVAGRRRVLKRYEDAQQRLASRLAPYQRKKQLSKKDQQAIKRLKVSLTDPEAALGWDKVGTYRPLYNLVLVQATDANLTLGWDVLGRNNDDGLLRPLMEKTTQQLGRPLREVLVDGGFVSVADVAWCEQQGITVYAPPGQAGAAPGEAAPGPGPKPPPQAAQPPRHNGAAKPPQQLAKGAFRYDSASGVYYCPQGKRLAEAFRTTEKRSGGLELPVIVHRASGQDCQACPQQKGCTSNPSKGRVVKRYQGEEALERLAGRMAEPASQRVYRLRCQSVELGYADLKEHRGLRVFRCFGSKRARTQAGLVILASNGLKILAALQRRDRPAQAHPPPEKRPA